MKNYEMKIRIRTSQIDKNGFLKPSSIFDLMQDCSFFQLDSDEHLNKFFSENNVTLFLASRQVDIYNLPRYSEDVIVKTYVYECNEYYGFRNTVIYDSNYNELVISNATGAFVDFNTGSLIRMPKDLIEYYNSGEKQNMNYLPRKISFDKDGFTEIDRFKVKKYFIDDNHHVNNARYIDMAIDYVDDDFDRVRIEYKTPAKLDDVIIVHRMSLDNKYILKLDGENNITYSVLEFSYNSF